jgi:hypothetical protein
MLPGYCPICCHGGGVANKPRDDCSHRRNPAAPAEPEVEEPQDPGNEGFSTQDSMASSSKNVELSTIGGTLDEEDFEPEQYLATAFTQLSIERSTTERKGQGCAGHYLRSVRDLCERPMNALQTKTEKEADHPGEQQCFVGPSRGEDAPSGGFEYATQDSKSSEGDSESNTGSSESYSMESVSTGDKSLPSLARSAIENRDDIVTCHVMAEFDRLFESLLQAFVRRCGTQSESLSCQDFGSGKNNGRKRSKASSHGTLKRRRATDEREDDAEESDGRRRDQGPGSSHMAKGQTPHMRLACPFRKHNALAYNIHTHRKCVEGHWPTTHRIK